MDSGRVMVPSVAVWLPSVVPVLPAIGLPTMPRTFCAVAPSQEPKADWSPIGQRMASIAPRATGTGTAWWQRGFAASTECPVKSRISITGSGSQYSPSAPSVAYALAMSSGVVADTPRVNAPHWCALAASLASLDARNWMPSCRAALTAFSAPISHSSGTQ